MINGKDKLIVAIDTDDFDKAKDLIDQLEDSVDIFKVGLEQYVATKGKTVEYLKEKCKKILQCRGNLCYRRKERVNRTEKQKGSVRIRQHGNTRRKETEESDSGTEKNRNCSTVCHRISGHPDHIQYSVDVSDVDKPEYE